MPEQKSVIYPRVSVIIPCYNCSDLIGKTLQSLENQTFKNFEVVLVNDGSSDSTLDVLEFWKQHSTLSIIVINQLNGGVSKARNKGIEIASSEYLLFLDSDDIYHEKYIELMINSLLDNNSDTVYCRLSRNFDDVKKLNVNSFDAVIHTQKMAMDKLLFEMGNYGFYCYLYKRKLLDNHCIRFDENTKFGEDREFNWKYLSHCNDIVWIDLPLYGYRINVNSATQMSASWRKTDLLLAVKRIEKYLEEQNSDYVDIFKDYMYARAMWAVAKTFALSANRSLFIRLQQEFDVKECMIRTLKDSHLIVSAASALYLVHPMLFYYIVKLKRN